MTNIKDRIKLKKDLLQSCMEGIEEKAESLRKVMDDAQQSANDYGQPKDRYDSYRTQLLRKRDMFGLQLLKILEQKTILEKLDPEKSYETVTFGSFVITDTQKVFVSVGMGKQECNGMEVYVISPIVPFFKSMEGKKVGDIFEFRDQKITILDII